MEKTLASFILLIICLLLYYKSIMLKKKYFQKATEFKSQIEMLKLKIIILEKKFDLNPISTLEVEELSNQVLELHEFFVDKHTK